jgi:DNA-directed RNA polymerase
MQAITDADRLARQLALETRQKAEAEDRLGRRTRAAEERSYASASVYGKTLLEASLAAVAAEIASRIGRISFGIPGPDHKLIAEKIAQADHRVLALIAMKVTLDVMGGKVFADHGQFTYTKLAIAVGMAVQTELRISWYQEQDPELYKAIRSRFHQGTGTRQKASVFRIQYNREGIEWKAWSNRVTLQIGGWLVDCLQRATGWLRVELLQESRLKRVSVVRLSSEFVAARDTIMARALSLASCMWPMVCEPVEWANGQQGGYLTSDVHRYSMVRAHQSVGVPLEQGELFLQMLNNLQRQAYRINTDVMAVADYCFDNFISIGKFRRDERKDPPARPAEGASEETIKEYKRSRRIIEDYNAQLDQNNWRTTETMFVARKFADEDRFWIPWSADYRGRLYPIPTSLTPQGTDFDKSLFYFADEGPVNEYWLAFHVATTYGLDKATMAERVEWTRSSTELITAIATDPISTITQWRQAEEPWCFLAAAIEYYNCCIAKTKATSGLPVGIDATCSGLQHLAALTLDATAGALVNVLPTEVPADGYRTVAEQAKKHLDAQYHPWMTRKVTKRTVMTTPYGVTRHSARGYIREALKEAGCDLSEPGVLSKITEAIYIKAMGEVFAGPVRVMNWIQESAARILRDGRESLRWTTPSGFVVDQRANRPTTERVSTQLLGSGKLRSSVYSGPGAIDLDKHKACTAPNLVHSLDASLLHFTFSEWEPPFTVIHDCAMARSCDVEAMGKALRLHFAEMYKGDVLKDWAQQVGALIPDGLIKGDLDIDLVNQSDYFFC